MKDVSFVIVQFLAYCVMGTVALDMLFGIEVTIGSVVAFMMLYVLLGQSHIESYAGVLRNKPK